jgi:hypothetical protein
MMVFPIRIKRLLDVVVQGSRHSYPGEHRRPVMLCNEQQRLHRGLPFFGIVFCLGQLDCPLRPASES